ncbi:hypothetical protein WUBG_05353 [Wuchereria bancrofti]|uniref:Uncharacterized protein n=1 Tax=Wuchereria bancrofti TaxID=6293 RepID=J9F2P7_WUCBA|nr:hypothetical protein WUBG_05353 [Wuchereria bancrofti]
MHACISAWNECIHIKYVCIHRKASLMQKLYDNSSPEIVDKIDSTHIHTHTHTHTDPKDPYRHRQTDMYLNTIGCVSNSMKQHFIRISNKDDVTKLVENLLLLKVKQSSSFMSQFNRCHPPS